MTQAITAQQVIKKRTEQLYVRSLDLSRELKELEAMYQARSAAIRQELTEISVEVDVLESYQDRRVVKFVREEVTVVEHTGRKKATDRLDFESSLVAIFSSSQRHEMKLEEIINELASMGWQWSSSKTASNYITRQSSLEKVPNRHGMYRLLR